MRNSPVHWSEGMFLRPQHFQAADRYWQELVETSEKWDHQYNYGVRSIEFSRDALANYQFELASCQARLRDGTLVAIEAGQDTGRVDLKDAVGPAGKAAAKLQEAFAKTATVMVYLAVPKLNLGRANVGRAEAEGHPRYTGLKNSFQDESRGGNDKEIELRSLNVRVLLSTDDLSGYEVLPIARIKRSGMKEAAPQLDEDYIPPCLAVESWPILKRDYVRAIYDIVGARMEVLSQQISHRGIGLQTQEPRQLERLLMLMTLDQAFGALRILSFASGVHPLVVYTELCRLVSALSFFDKQRRPGEIPVYDHDDLCFIFKWAKQEISRLLDALGDLPYEQRYFIGTPNKGMQVTLDPKWLGSGWQWYVGVQRGNLLENECREIVAYLDWKIGSARQVDLLFQAKAKGVTLDPIERVPHALPPQGWIYYAVGRDDAAWKDVQATLSLAMRLREDVIQNLNELPGQRDLVISARGRQATLQISLFAVNPQT